MLSRFEVGLSLGCEVMFMNVCAEGRTTASAGWMPPSLHHASKRRPAPDTRAGSMATVLDGFYFFFFLYYHTTANFIQANIGQEEKFNK